MHIHDLTNPNFMASTPTLFAARMNSDDTVRRRRREAVEQEEECIDESGRGKDERIKWEVKYYTYFGHRYF